MLLLVGEECLGGDPGGDWPTVAAAIISSGTFTPRSVSRTPATAAFSAASASSELSIRRNSGSATGVASITSSSSSGPMPAFTATAHISSSSSSPMTTSPSSPQASSMSSGLRPSGMVSEKPAPCSHASSGVVSSAEGDPLAFIDEFFSITALRGSRYCSRKASQKGARHLAANPSLSRASRITAFAIERRWPMLPLRLPPAATCASFATNASATRRRRSPSSMSARRSRNGPSSGLSTASKMRHTRLCIRLCQGYSKNSPRIAGST
mmetsp:Transcript_42824/g.101893  ORF Transcript_42824/g.101893 Transcript_42824/m.101893 type:complete len:267 (-) Transcript_42824:500-1300(-)